MRTRPRTRSRTCTRTRTLRRTRMLPHARNRAPTLTRTRGRARASTRARTRTRVPPRPQRTRGPKLVNGYVNSTHVLFCGDGRRSTHCVCVSCEQLKQIARNSNTKRMREHGQQTTK